MSKTIKYIIIVVLVLVIIAVAYFMFFGKTANVPAAAPNTALQTSAGTAPVNSVVSQTPLSEAEATRISQEFVNQLLNLQAIKLKDDILSSLAFQSLQDFSITLVQPGNEGRPNPFAPFGADGTEPNASGTDSNIIFTPGQAWNSVKLGNSDIFYASTWTYETINSTPQNGGQPSVVGYTFNLPNGNHVSFGGLQSACTSSMFGSFQYGVSTKTCVRGATVELTGSTLTTEDKNAFGDFIQRNI